MIWYCHCHCFNSRFLCKRWWTVFSHLQGQTPFEAVVQSIALQQWRIQLQSSKTPTFEFDGNMLTQLDLCYYASTTASSIDGARAIMLLDCPSMCTVCMHTCLPGQRRSLTGLPSTFSFHVCHLLEGATFRLSGLSWPDIFMRKTRFILLILLLTLSFSVPTLHLTDVREVSKRRRQSVNNAVAVPNSRHRRRQSLSGYPRESCHKSLQKYLGMFPGVVVC